MTHASHNEATTEHGLKHLHAIEGNTTSHHHEPLTFPKGFLWGTATSAYQVEGGNINSDWYEWEKKHKGKLVRMACGKATNHYALFQDDFELVKEMHQNAHRLSIEWARIEPREGVWDYKELEHYREVLHALKSLKIKVMLTLHHFTNPQWFSDVGGWTSPHAVQYFERYVRFVSKYLGEYVDFWITINEPLVYVSQAYIAGVWAPGIKSPMKAFKVFRTLLKAHKVAYEVIHERCRDRCMVGIANNVISLYAYRKHAIQDQLLLQATDWMWNHSFYTFSRSEHDFLGVNYYFHYRIKNATLKPWNLFIDIKKENRDASDIGWEVYPPGIFDALLDLNAYQLPIYITENGIATDNDDRRARFLVSYLKEIYHAIGAGVKVKGYFYWSLLDNYEWEKGFDARFGLVGVDFKTYRRTVRPSGDAYTKICKDNAIAHELLKLLGHSVSL